MAWFRELGCAVWREARLGHDEMAARRGTGRGGNTGLKRVRRLPRMRHPHLRLSAIALRRLRVLQAGRIQLQAPMVLSVLLRAALCADGSASGRSLLCAGAGAAVGAGAAHSTSPVAGRAAQAAGAVPHDHVPRAQAGWPQGQSGRQRRGHAKLRSLVTPQKPNLPAPEAKPAERESTRAHHRPVRLSWARWLKRVFDPDLRHCASCADQMKTIAAILE